MPGDPELEMGIALLIDFKAYGSGKPLSISCFRRTKDAATMAKVVRTAPIPHEKTRAVWVGSVSLIIRR